MHHNSLSTTRSYGMYFALLATSLSFLPGCQAIEGIFKAGVWVGVVVVVAVLALAGGLMAVLRR